MRFTIAPNGQVAKVKIAESGLDDAAVEGCLTGVMKTLRFPQPKGGGVVVVTYPFVFAQT